MPEPDSSPPGHIYISAAGDVNIAGDVVAGNKLVQNIHNFFASLDDARERRHLQVLLGKVKAFWVEGLLRQSLHGAPPIALRQTVALHTAPPGLAPTQASAPSTLAAFERSGRSLLILGAAGAGKTITLLELARDLIAQAERDPALPIPVVFPLASWAGHRLPLIDWLAEELSAQYQIPRQIGRRWLSQHAILPLLDALDEVREDALAACVAAINAYQSQHGLSGLVVTCRSSDYERLSVRLNLNTVIVLQPLEPQQVDAWLEAGGARLVGLRAALAADPALRELATTPLLLQVMALALADQPAAALAGAPTVEAARKRVFDLYVQRMLARPVAHRDPRLKEWLRNLARGLLSHRRSIFLIEQLEPIWLPAGAVRWAYHFGLWAVLAVFIAGVLGLMLISSFTEFGLTRLVLGRLGGLLGVGAAALLQALWLGGQGPQRMPAMRSSSQTLPVLVGIGAGLLIGLLHWLGETAVALARGWPDPFTSGFLFALVRGGVSGLLFGLLWSLLGDRGWEDLIQPVEALGWRWETAFRGLLRGVQIGGLVGAAIGVVFTAAVSATIALNPDLRSILSAGMQGFNALEVTVVLITATVIFLCASVPASALGVGGLGAVIGALIGGLRGRSVTQRTRPNQGIWQSARNAVIVGVLFTFIGSVLSVVAFASLFALNDPAWLQPDYLLSYVILAFTSGWALGLIGALRYGGLAVCQHAVLRVLLAASGQLPVALVPALEEACDRALLQRVGGYVFIHRTLLEYFAASR